MFTILFSKLIICTLKSFALFSENVYSFYYKLIILKTKNNNHITNNSNIEIMEVIILIIPVNNISI